MSDALPVTKPTARWHAGKGHGLALRVVAAHFQQAFNQAKPIGDGFADSAYKVTGVGFGHSHVVDGAFLHFAFQCVEPRNGIQFTLVGWASALVQ